MSAKYSGWTVFRKNGPTSWTVIPLRSDELISEEQWKILQAIHDLPIGKGGAASVSVAGLVSAEQPGSSLLSNKSFKRPTLTVSELNGGCRFFDIYVKVVEIIQQDGQKCDLLCTDYTQNELLK